MGRRGGLLIRFSRSAARERIERDGEASEDHAPGLSIRTCVGFHLYRPLGPGNFSGKDPVLLVLRG
jgi:hypothetical protein